MRFLITMLVCLTLLTGAVWAEEVPKGQIPAEHLSPDCASLPWGVAGWDVDEAVAAMGDKEAKVLWVDTRPSSFFKQGTVRDAVLLVYDKSGAAYPDGEPVCTKESLEAAMTAAGSVPPGTNRPGSSVCTTTAGPAPPPPRRRPRHR